MQQYLTILEEGKRYAKWEIDAFNTVHRLAYQGQQYAEW